MLSLKSDVHTIKNQYPSALTDWNKDELVKELKISDTISYHKMDDYVERLTQEPISIEGNTLLLPELVRQRLSMMSRFGDVKLKFNSAFNTFDIEGDNIDRRLTSPSNLRIITLYFSKIAKKITQPTAIHTFNIQTQNSQNGGYTATLESNRNSVRDSKNSLVYPDRVLEAQIQHRLKDIVTITTTGGYYGTAFLLNQRGSVATTAAHSVCDRKRKAYDYPRDSKDCIVEGVFLGIPELQSQIW